MANKKSISALLGEIEKTEVSVPKQKIVPVSSTENLASLTFFMDKDFKKFLKYFAVNNDVTIKELINNSLTNSYGKDFEQWKGKQVILK